jgi:hypothetical protein
MEDKPMPEWKRRLLGLGLPCLLAFAFDIGLTLYNQPAEYWVGDYSRTTEGAPFQRKMYEIHPLAAVAGHGLWAGIILTWILFMPEVVAVILAIAIVFGHTAGGYTGLGTATGTADGSAFGIGPRWFQSLHGVLFVSATVLGLGVYWSLWTARLDSGEPRSQRLHPLTRWSLLGIASALACYMCLIPQ